MHWDEIKKFTQIHYRVCVPWNHLEDNLVQYAEQGLKLDPDFQRGQQQIAFVEFALKEPQSGLEIFFNHPGWMSSWEGEFVLVDGKQRLEAARRFLKNEIPAFGCLYRDFTGYKHIPYNIQFYFNIAMLKTRAEVLQWYVDFNAGGTPHTVEEIERVRKMIKKEKGVL